MYHSDKSFRLLPTLEAAIANISNVEERSSTEAAFRRVKEAVGNLTFSKNKTTNEEPQRKIQRTDSGELHTDFPSVLKSFSLDWK